MYVILFEEDFAYSGDIGKIYDVAKKWQKEKGHSVWMVVNEVSLKSGVGWLYAVDLGFPKCQRCSDIECDEINDDTPDECECDFSDEEREERLEIHPVTYEPKVLYVCRNCNVVWGGAVSNPPCTCKQIEMYRPQS